MVEFQVKRKKGDIVNETRVIRNGDDLLSLSGGIAAYGDRYRVIGVIAGLCGWKSENALRAAFLKRYGCSMRQWRRNHVQ